MAGRSSWKSDCEWYFLDVYVVDIRTHFINAIGRRTDDDIVAFRFAEARIRDIDTFIAAIPDECWTKARLSLHSVYPSPSAAADRDGGYTILSVGNHQRSRWHPGRYLLRL